MARTCAYRYLQHHSTSEDRCSKVKVPLDAVLPGERPEMEKVYVDVPQIEYVLWPRWKGNIQNMSILQHVVHSYKCQRLYMYVT